MDLRLFSSVPLAFQLMDRRPGHFQVGRDVVFEYLRGSFDGMTRHRRNLAVGGAGLGHAHHRRPAQVAGLEMIEAGGRPDLAEIDPESLVWKRSAVGLDHHGRAFGPDFVNETLCIIGLAAQETGTVDAARSDALARLLKIAPALEEAARDIQSVNEGGDHEG